VGNKGFARRDAAEDANPAVQRAADRIRAAALDLPGASLPCSERTSGGRSLRLDELAEVEQRPLHVDPVIAPHV
jgi:hypothetical protein